MFHIPMSSPMMKTMLGFFAEPAPPPAGCDVAQDVSRPDVTVSTARPCISSFLFISASLPFCLGFCSWLILDHRLRCCCGSRRRARNVSAPGRCCGAEYRLQFRFVLVRERRLEHRAAGALQLLQHLVRGNPADQDKQ